MATIGRSTLMGGSAAAIAAANAVPADAQDFGKPHPPIVAGTRASYRAGPATDAWVKLTAWYGKYLTTT